MSIRYKDTEYTYISAKVRAMENSLATRECLFRMVAAENTDAAAVYLREYGLELCGLNAAEREDELLRTLGQALSELERNSPTPETFAFFRYPYDCSNIKSLIKCRLRGIDPSSMLFSIGTVPIKKLCEGYERKDLSELPEAMAKAAPEAEKAYAETKNPQLIDFILDRACFADMDALAKKCELPFLSELMCARADLANLMITLRILRMNCANYAQELLAAALVDCGRIGKTRFEKAFALGEAEVIALLPKAGYQKLADKLSPGIALGEAERLCDNERMRTAMAAKRKTFGPEIPLGFVVALEAEIQNIRIVLAGKDAALAPETISERIRDSYV